MTIYLSRDRAFQEWKAGEKKKKWGIGADKYIYQSSSGVFQGHFLTFLTVYKRIILQHAHFIKHMFMYEPKCVFLLSFSVSATHKYMHTHTLVRKSDIFL